MIVRVRRDVPLLLRTLKQSLYRRRRLPAPKLLRGIQMIIVIIIMIITTIELIPLVPLELEPVISGAVGKQGFGAGRLQYGDLILVLPLGSLE